MYIISNKMPVKKLLTVSSQKSDTSQSYRSISIKVPFTAFTRVPRYLKLLEFEGDVADALVTAVGSQNNKIPVWGLPLVVANSQTATVGDLALASTNAQIATAVQTALNALTFYASDGVTPSDITFTVSWNSGTKKFTISADRAFYLIWSGSSVTPAALLGWNEETTIGDGTTTSFSSPVPVPDYSGYGMSADEMNYHMISESLAPGRESGIIPLDGVTNYPNCIGVIPISSATAYQTHEDEPGINIDGSNFVANYKALTTLSATVTVDFTLKLASGMNLVDSTTRFWTAKLLFSDEPI